VIEVVAAIIEREGRYLIARRSPGKHLEGFWEFPGGKIEDGETPEESLRREMREEFGVHADVGGYVGDNVHDYGSKIIRLLAYQVSVTGDLLQSTDHDRIEWVRLEEMRDYPLAEADIPLLECIAANA
jgi:8-oxo-dGTP diphosphatase